MEMNLPQAQTHVPAQVPAQVPTPMLEQPTQLSRQTHPPESKIFLSALLLTSSVLTLALFDLPWIVTQFSSSPQQAALSLAPLRSSAPSLASSPVNP